MFLGLVTTNCIFLHKLKTIFGTNPKLQSNAFLADIIFKVKTVNKLNKQTSIKKVNFDFRI